MNVYAARAKLEEQLAIWKEVLRTGELTDDERSTYSLEERMSRLPKSNGARKRTSTHYDANAFEPVATNEEAHSATTL